MSSIFGKPAQQNNISQNQSTSTSQNSASSSSNNQAYPMLNQALGGQVNNGTGASNSLSALLGVGGDPAAQQQAFNQWKGSTGYQFGLNQGTQAITGSNAAKGLLNSGATGKALETYGQNYANTQYQNYLNPLQSLVSSGNQAAGTIGNAGQQSNSQSSGMSNSQSAGTSSGSSTGAKQGIGGFLGALM